MLSKKVLISALFVAGSAAVCAQTSTNSPYTRYGLGDLSDQAFANNAAMGGIGYGLRNSLNINTMNPASYSSVDSLSFMFDIGMSLKSSNYREGGINSNAKNSSFDYVAMQFRLHPRLGIAFGFTPYSTVGHKFGKTSSIEGSDVTITNVFYGEGGLQQIFGGLGFKILDNLSIGANAGYLYGDINYQTAASFSNRGDQTITYNNLSVKSYNVSFGLQYTQPFNKDNSLTIGLVYGLGHNMNSTEVKGIQVAADNTSSSTSDSYNVVNEREEYNGYGIPHTFGAGLTFTHKQKLTVGADYTLQQWSKAKYNNTEGLYYQDRSKVAVGAEYTPNLLSRNYLGRIRYRVGAYYSTPYLNNLPTGEGPSEYGISAGFGFPLYLFQKHTMLSITGQYVRVNPSISRMLSEDRFVIKLGLTFNERWFMKWRVQ